MLNVIDEFTRACLAIPIDRKLRFADVIDVFSDLFILRGVPDHIRSELPMVAPLVRATIGDGPEFIAKAVRAWIGAVGARTACIAPGIPWENGYGESFNAKLRDEPLDGEIFFTLAEAKIVVESWRRHCTTKRPHASLGNKPPAPEVFIPVRAGSATVNAPTFHSDPPMGAGLVQLRAAPRATGYPALAAMGHGIDVAGRAGAKAMRRPMSRAAWATWRAFSTAGYRPLGRV